MTILLALQILERSGRLARKIQPQSRTIGQISNLLPPKILEKILENQNPPPHWKNLANRNGSNLLWNQQWKNLRLLLKFLLFLWPLGTKFFIPLLLQIRNPM